MNKHPTLTGIIVAMDEELSVIQQDLQQSQRILRAQMEFHRGLYFGHPVVAVVCGVGKVNAALCTQILISEFHVQRIINIGSAGGIAPELQPGDVVIADTLIQHDMDVSPLGLPLGQIYRCPYFDFPTDEQLRQQALAAAPKLVNRQILVGRIATGDQFIADPQQARFIHEHFQALACEMESASIAQVCALNERPFICVRSISDNANSGAHMDFEEFLPIAVKNASILLETLFCS